MKIMMNDPSFLFYLDTSPGLLEQGVEGCDTNRKLNSDVLEV
jgi:hypothetical protein